MRAAAERVIVVQTVGIGVTTPPEGPWDVVHGLLRPREHVRALEKVGTDLVAVHVSDGNDARIVWLRKFSDGDWEEASALSVGGTLDNRASRSDGASRGR